MKKIITTLSLCIFSLVSIACTNEVKSEKSEPETKRVCVMQKDAKTGKDKEVCREMKIHKKLDGQKVPQK
jgi:hypothetical protein